MSDQIESILGLGPIDKERKIPGSSFIEGREYRYISCSDSTDIAFLFKKVTREISPPLAKNGGVINEGCRVVLPSGDCYFAVSYKGDIEGWREQIEKGAAKLELSVATIAQDKLLLDDDSEVLLSDCKFKFE